MSPYRVLVKDRNGNKRIFAAMMCMNQRINQHKIRIVERLGNPAVDVNNASRLERKRLAHQMTTSKNSTFCGIYLPWFHPDMDVYVLTRKFIPELMSTAIPGMFFTQSECLVGAMYDYLTINRLQMIEVL